MRFILIISFLFSLLLANETRLVIGCFKEPVNAQKAKIKIDNYVKSNEEFKNFLQKNSITTKYKSIGEWHVISFEPFSDSKTLFMTYFKIRGMYPDAYKVAIDAGDEQKVLASNYKEETPLQDNMQQEQASQNEKMPTYQSEMEPSSLSEEKAAAPMPVEQVQKKATPEITRETLKKDKTTKESADTGVSYLYPLIAIVFMIVILILYFTKKKPKKTLQTLKEEIHDELS